MQAVIGDNSSPARFAVTLAAALLLGGAGGYIVGTSVVPHATQAPAPVHVQPPSAAEDRPVIERAEDGPKQCIGPREIEGPLCS